MCGLKNSKKMSIVKCQKECLNTHGCFYWTYRRKGTNKGRCYLKRWGVAGREIRDKDWESGHRACEPTKDSTADKECMIENTGPGTNSQLDGDVKTLKACQYSCFIDDDCKYWTFNSVEKKCHLLKDKAGVNLGKTPNSVFGKKFCNPESNEVEDAKKCTRKKTSGWIHNQIDGNAVRNANDAKACKVLCDTGCKFWSFYKNGGQGKCILLKDKKGVLFGVVDNYTFGAKDCVP